MQTVIFDLDGTLADTSGDLIAAANACFRGAGHGDILDMSRDRATAFHGGRAMLRLGGRRLKLSQSDCEAWVETQYHRLLEHYEKDIDTHTTLYPGLEAALDKLAADGYILGVCTNKPEALAEILLQRLGIRDRFAALVGADTLPTRKPDPAPFVAAVERAGGKMPHSVLIGDTETDRMTARAAGVPAVLVTFGPGGRAVADLSPEALLDHYDGLAEIVARLNPRLAA